MRRPAPLAFRWLVACAVAVLALLGGALRTPPTAFDALRAHLVLERASEDGDQTTFERGRAHAAARASRPSHASDDGRGPEPSIVAQPSRIAFDRAEGERIASVDPGIGVRPRRVRAHVEHMVFLN